MESGTQIYLWGLFTIELLFLVLTFIGRRNYITFEQEWEVQLQPAKQEGDMTLQEYIVFEKFKQLHQAAIDLNRRALTFLFLLNGSAATTLLAQSFKQEVARNEFLIRNPRTGLASAQLLTQNFEALRLTAILFVFGAVLAITILRSYHGFYLENAHVASGGAKADLPWHGRLVDQFGCGGKVLNTMYFLSILCFVVGCFLVAMCWGLLDV